MYGDQKPNQQGQEKRAHNPTHCCANCEIEFQWPPTLVGDKIYCCLGCARGGPCCCDYSLYNAVKISGVIYYGPDIEKKSVDSPRS